MDLKNVLDEMILDKADPNKCKGLVFRAKTNIYMLENRILQRKELRLLKRKSCPGCEKCGGWLEDIQEHASNGWIDISHIEPGKLYTPIHTHISRDWETGYVDYYRIEFKEIKETP